MKHSGPGAHDENLRSRTSTRGRRPRSRWALLPVRTRLLVIGGVPVVILACFLAWNIFHTAGGNPSSDRAQGLIDSPRLSVPNPSAAADDAAGGELGGLPDAFAAAAKNDYTNTDLPLLSDNKVTITLQGDGQMYFGYLFRSGPGNVKFAPNSFSVSYTVVGGKPFALAAVQAMQGTSYVTCTISVNGTVAARSRANGEGQIAGCRF